MINKYTCYSLFIGWLLLQETNGKKWSHLKGHRVASIVDNCLVQGNTTKGLRINRHAQALHITGGSIPNILAKNVKDSCLGAWSVTGSLVHTCCTWHSLCRMIKILPKPQRQGVQAVFTELTAIAAEGLKSLTLIMERKWSTLSLHLFVLRKIYIHV